MFVSVWWVSPYQPAIIPCPPQIANFWVGRQRRINFECQDVVSIAARDRTDSLNVLGTFAASLLGPARDRVFSQISL